MRMMSIRGVMGMRVDRFIGFVMCCMAFLEAVSRPAFWKGRQMYTRSAWVRLELHLTSLDWM